MRRREFFSFAAAGAASLPAQASVQPERIEEIVRKIEDAIRAEIPGITKVRVDYDPTNAEVPLMVVAFRFSDQSQSSA